MKWEVGSTLDVYASEYLYLYLFTHLSSLSLFCSLNSEEYFFENYWLCKNFIGFMRSKSLKPQDLGKAVPKVGARPSPPREVMTYLENPRQGVRQWKLLLGSAFTPAGQQEDLIQRLIVSRTQKRQTPCGNRLLGSSRAQQACPDQALREGVRGHIGAGSDATRTGVKAARLGRSP